VLMWLVSVFISLLCFVLWRGCFGGGGVGAAAVNLSFTDVGTF
jgi:hypothetical protein